MKKVNSYYFSVDGENEKWYFEHLQNLINKSDKSTFNVKFIIKTEKSPSGKRELNTHCPTPDVFHNLSACRL